MGNYLITGGCGFIGSTLIEKLISNGSKLFVIDNLSTGKISNLPKSKKITFLKKSVQNIDDFNIDKLDGIFHLAAQTSVPKSIDNFYESTSNNLLSSMKIFDFAVKNLVPIVYASSSAVYGNLKLGSEKIENYDIISPYAQDKLTMEHYSKMIFKVYDLPSIGLRFFNVYGPKQDPNNPYSGVISIFINNLLKGQPIIINGGYQTRDFIYIDNIVSTMIISMEVLKKRKICEVLNVGTGISITINNLLKQLINISKTNPEIINKELPDGDPEKSAGNYEKLKMILGIDISTFVNINAGLNKTFEYCKNIKLL